MSRPGAGRFVLSAPSWRQLPRDQTPEVAFAGRSNVGKSTLAGAILGAPSLVRTSRTPGRTRLLNYFCCTVAGQPLGLCDLPGYGYARMGRGELAAMRQMTLNYLRHREELGVVVVVVDARLDAPSALDLAALRQLQVMGRTVLVAASKCDQLAKSRRQGRLHRLAHALGLQPEAVLACAAPTGLGVDALREQVVAHLGLGGARPVARLRPRAALGE